MNKKLDKIYTFLIDALALIILISLTIGSVTFMALMIRIAQGLF